MPKYHKHRPISLQKKKIMSSGKVLTCEKVNKGKPCFSVKCPCAEFEKTMMRKLTGR